MNVCCCLYYWLLIGLDYTLHLKIGPNNQTVSINVLFNQIKVSKLFLSSSVLQYFWREFDEYRLAALTETQPKNKRCSYKISAKYRECSSGYEIYYSGKCHAVYNYEIIKNQGVTVKILKLTQYHSSTYLI